MKLANALELIKKSTKTETEVNIIVNGLQIEVSGYNELSQTCYITFTMKELGKRIGEDYLGDSYWEEVAIWDVYGKVKELADKLGFT